MVNHTSLTVAFLILLGFWYAFLKYSLKVLFTSSKILHCLNFHYISLPFAANIQHIKHNCLAYNKWPFFFWLGIS